MSTTTVRLSRTGPPGTHDFVAHPSGQLQVCRATVATGDRIEHFTLFLPADTQAAPIAFDSLPAVSEEVADSVDVLVRETGGGRAIVEVSQDHESRAVPVASAVAVMRASWGWDETPTIVVTVNDAPVAVAPRFTKDGCTALVIASPAA